MNNVTNPGIMADRHSNITVHGDQTVIHAMPSTRPEEGTKARKRAKGIGVVAIKAAETKAVIDAFGLIRQRDAVSGQDFYTGEVESADGPVPLVAAQTLQQGNRSIMRTLENLRSACNPALFVIVGVGGAISPRLAIGDVVVADRVIYYDLRREASDGTHRRGEERQAPAAITYAVNSFFVEHGEAPRLRTADGAFQVLTGPIGSGDALVVDAESEIRKYLLAYNEYVLALDMEAGGLTQFCHESPPIQPGWLVVRGISDLADDRKTEEHQLSAAHHAATTLRHLIPYLPATV